MEEQLKSKLQIGIRYLIEDEYITYHGKSRRMSKEIIPIEIKIIEFSKSGLYVKVKYPNNSTYSDTYEWQKTENIKIMEQLS